MITMLFGALALAQATPANPAQTTMPQTMPQATTPQTMPAPAVAPAAPATTTDAPAAAPAEALTDAETKTLERCKKMAPGQAAQSSKCSAVMTKAGQGDPAKQRATPAQ